MTHIPSLFSFLIFIIYQWFLEIWLLFHKIASQRLQFGTQNFLTSLTIFSIKCDLCRFFTYDTHTQSSKVAYFHHLPMISGNLTPIPQNSIPKTTVWHTKFSHISQNFLNKMRLVPISHIWHTYPVFLVCLFSSFSNDFWKSDSYSTK